MTAARESSVECAAPPRERLELLLNQLDRLPTLPSTVVRLLAVTGDENSSADDLVRIIEPDPVLTVGVLRMLRRADLAAPRQSPSVAKAVTLLGFRAVRNAALTGRLFDALTTGDRADASQRRNQLWRHCIAVACAAEAIVEQLPTRRSHGDAFVAGLLHDIGKIALDACFPKSYARVLDRAAREPGCVCDWEQRVLGLDHTAAGRRLALRWGLPPALADAVWLHHQAPDLLPPTVADPDLVRIVHLADALVRNAGLGDAGSRHAVDTDAVCACLGLEPTCLSSVIEETPRRMAPLCEALGLENDIDPAAQTASLIEAKRQLSRLAAKLTADNEHLQRRARCLHAVAALFDDLEPQRSLAEVCANASTALLEFFHADQVVVLAIDPDQPLLHVGLRASENDHATAVILDAPASDAFDTPLQAFIPTPANGAIEGLFARCTAAPPAAALWVFPIQATLRAIGIVEASPDKMAPHRRPTEECAILGNAIGSALASARARTSADRMTQDVLDLNRRLHAAQADVARQRSLAMIAAMAGGAAHELNNPLAVISARAQMELAQAADPDRRRAMSIIIEQAQRASGIVNELMGFAKPAPPQPAQQSLSGAVALLCQHWCARSRIEPAQLQLVFHDPRTTLFCDPDQLRELLEAILTNAADATDPDRRTIKVNSRSPASDETVRIRVEDNGVGMSREVLEHALDPFFSSRPAGRSRGLGLSRAYRLAEINGGRLWLESTPSKGTTVTIELPARAPRV